MKKSLIPITSRDNGKVKNAKKVRDGKEKNLVFIEGLRVCEEALRANLGVKECFFESGFDAAGRGSVLLEKLFDGTVSVNEVSPAVFSSIADTKSSQGIVLIAEKPEASKENIEALTAGEKKTGKLVLFLFEINNPSNLGAILRTAEAAGVPGVIISTKSADVFSQKSTRAAMGANFRIPVWANADFDEVIEWAKANGYMTTAADIRSAQKYTEIDWRQNRLLIFGSEAHGLSAEHLKMIEEKIYIPMANEVESLNLAVSCGIILFEAKRR